jgi:CPA2 family monovalent cation:H+ antiporter-2
LNIPCVVIDLDPKTISALRGQEVPCIYGDAGNQKVLYEAGIKDAAALVLAIPDPVAIRLAFDNARRINPNLDIVARVHSDSEFELLKKKGVSETVRPETEAGLEIVRHILCRLNIPQNTVEEVISNERKTCPM